MSTPAEGFHPVRDLLPRPGFVATPPTTEGPRNEYMRYSRQDGAVEVLQLSLPGGREVEASVLGPNKGRPILYFHSPATSGEEIGDAASVAARLHIRLITLRRPSVVCDEPSDFVDAVAKEVAAVVNALALDRPTLLGWSGGAPYALASAAYLGSGIDSVHLVSPVPGPLTGPDAVPNQSDRLRQVANTTATSPWVTEASALRDYQAVAAPWTFGLKSIAQRVTIWAPTEDQIVPVSLAERLAELLPDGAVIEVPGAHDWLTQNWATVLERMAS